MARTRAELDSIRSANRQAMGMAGLPGPVTVSTAVGPYTGPVVRAKAGMADSVPGGFLSAIPPVRVGSSFPPVDYTWDPSQPSAPVQSQGSPVAEWVNRHVVRPFVEVGPIRYAPGDGYADYSGVALVAAGLVAVFCALTGTWVLWRAFGPRGAKSS